MANSDTGGNTDTDKDDSKDTADTNDTTSWQSNLPLSRRDTLLAGIGLGGLSLLGSQRTSADHKHPVTSWNRHQTAQGQYSLFDLKGLNMESMDHENEIEDFAGPGLVIDGSVLTVDLGNEDLDGRYLVWNSDDHQLDFSGAAEWGTEVADPTPNSADGAAAVAVGGEDNDANGDHSLAAGEGATAEDDGSFVWATGDATSRGEDSVLFQAPGGLYFASGDIEAEDGSITASEDVTAVENVNAGSDVTADGDITSGSDVTADSNVTAQTGDIEAADGDVEGDDVIARQQVQTDTVHSDAELTLDAANDVTAQTDVNVEGDLHVTGTKHFVSAVDTPAGPKQIAYTAVEAGKPRTEVTDVADLSDGRAMIDLPDHFRMVTSEDEPLSVQVTPYASEKVHPQVVQKGLDRIVVEDLSDGPGEYRITYTVKGVREGYEDTPIVQDP